MKLTVPEILKTILVDDWEAVTKNNQVRLFRSHTSTQYTKHENFIASDTATASRT